MDQAETPPPDPAETGGGPDAASLRGMLEDRAARLGPAPFLTLSGTRLSYADTDELANRAAAVLAGVGVGPGDVVAARCANTVAMAATWFGCAKLGAVFMPVNGLLTHAPLRNVLAHARVATVVCDADLYPTLAAVAGDLPQLTTVLVAGGPAPAGTRSFDDLVDAAPSGAPPTLGGDAASPTKLMYTSGTTGTPKGVLWSRGCEATWARHYGDELVQVAEGEAVYCCLPLSHVTCQGSTLATLWRGGHMTIDARFEPFAFWNRIREVDAVVFTFVGTILSVLGRRRPRPDDGDNPVRRILGAAAPVELWRHIEERFGLEIVETWGQTETASCWTRPLTLPQAPGSIGRPTDRFEARVVDGDGGERPLGHPGELWIRPLAPHVMFDGYLGSDGEVTGDSWTADGWYRTGDLMAWREDGDLTFVGRLREAIRRRGEMIAAGDIEQAALAHRCTGEAAAVGVPADDGVEEEVKLSVVAAEGAVIDPAELHAHLSASLPRFMVPRYLDVRHELPKTPTTRVRKYVLSDEGSAGCWDARRHLVAGAATGPDSRGGPAADGGAAGDGRRGAPG